MIVNDTIDAIDCHYGGPGKTTAYLLEQDGRATFVDNNTTLAVPHLLAALERRGIPRENVDYAIITHVHLDHAGGTAALLEACPNAKVLAHPRAARHLINPDRLIAGAKVVYGEEQFHFLYGDILPVAEDRVLPIEDNGLIVWNGRRLRFLHTLGHATHHFCIHDEESNAIFTGDNFGIGRSSLMRPGPDFLICSCTPPEFDAPQYRIAVARILETGADTACIGHFGPFSDLERCAKQLLRSIGLCEGILFAAVDSGLEGGELTSFCIDSVAKSMPSYLAWCGVDNVEDDVAWLEGDIALNGMGLAAAATRMRKRDAVRN